MSSTKAEEDRFIKTVQTLQSLKPDDRAHVYSLDPVLIEAIAPGASQLKVDVFPGQPDLELAIGKRYGGGRWRVLVKNAKGKLVATLRFSTIGPSLLRMHLPE